MRPVLFHLGGVPVPTHDVFVVLGVCVALLVFSREIRHRGRADPRLWQLAAGGLITGAVFARISTSWRYLAATPDPSLLGLWLHGGKSVLGGLAGAYFGVLLTKRIVGYPRRTGHLFAPAVALGLAVGRIGCFLAEPPGTPTALPWGVSLSPAAAARLPTCESCLLGLPLHPTFLYEVAFHLTAFAILVRFGPRLQAEGETFPLYLLAYGLFRFTVEFVRENPTMLAGLSGPQLFLAVTLPLLAIHVARQARHGVYHGRPAEDLEVMS
jgi:phosphatidylglycerol---prolipoprotein diacylglyceryl transferase